MESTTITPERTHDKPSWEREQDAPANGQHLSETRPASIWQEIQGFRIEFGPSTKDILSFTNQLAVMVRAGISLQDSLDSIAVEAKNRKFRAIITDLKRRIEGGESFSQALASHGQVFGSLYVSMVAAAEVS